MVLEEEVPGLASMLVMAEIPSLSMGSGTSLMLRMNYNSNCGVRGVFVLSPGRGVSRCICDLFTHVTRFDFDKILLLFFSSRNSFFT